MRKILSITISLLFSFILHAQEEQLASVFARIVPRETANQHQRFPVIKLHSEQAILFSFDLIEADDDNLSYQVEKLNSDFHPSELNTIEYIDGFAEGKLPPAEYSEGTMVKYLHYEFALPNEQTKFKESGNYRVDIFKSGEPDQIITSYYFAVAEQSAELTTELFTRPTAYNEDSEQRLSFTLKPHQMDTMDKYKIVILQNGRLDNRQVLTEPSFRNTHELRYENYRSAVFEGGNEYHKLEQSNTQGLGMGVSSRAIADDVVALQLYPQSNRSAMAYVYDEDQNGRRYPTSAHYEPQIESDYCWVSFTFTSPKLEAGDIVLEGEAFEHLPLADRLMNYDDEARAYRKDLLVKLGYVEYQFLFKPYGSDKLLSLPTEGSHSQTTNDYTILVYKKSPNFRGEKVGATNSVL